MSRTLLQLLVENLSEWPKGVELAVQDSSGWVGFGVHESRVEFVKGVDWWIATGYNCWDENPTFRLNERASDYDTAIVCEADWIKAKKGYKPNNIYPTMSMFLTAKECKEAQREWWAKQLFFSMYMESEAHWNILTDDERNKYYKAIDAGWTNDVLC